MKSLSHHDFEALICQEIVSFHRLNGMASVEHVCFLWMESKGNFNKLTLTETQCKCICQLYIPPSEVRTLIAGANVPAFLHYSVSSTVLNPLEHINDFKSFVYSVARQGNQFVTWVQR